jgi:hypothetical protein
MRPQDATAGMGQGTGNPVFQDGWGAVRGRHLRWGLRSRIAEHPFVYLPLARLKYGQQVVGSESKLVIDGFTRSGVPFAVIAFQASQRTPVRVAHTLHAPAHVAAAVRRRIPTLVTIRDPEAAVLSAIIREPYVTAEQGLRAWIRFYTRILAYRDGFVLGMFDDVVADYGRVIRQINEKFGTGFDEFVHTDQNVETCFEIIEDRARRPPWSDALGRFECGLIGLRDYQEVVDGYGAAARLAPIPEARIPRPSAEREVMKEALVAQIWGPSLRDLRLEARRLFAEYGGQIATPIDPVAGVDEAD